MTDFMIKPSVSALGGEYSPRMPGSRLAAQITEAIAALDRAGARWALIGGLALASHRVVRATQDVDLLLDSSQSDAVDSELSRIGYRCIHRSPDSATYVREDERIDLLYATRPIARGLLANASELQTALGRLRVISAEGLIGFKLQAYVNDPERTQDLEDIRRLLRENAGHLDLGEVREYDDCHFAAEGGIGYAVAGKHDPYSALDDLMVVVEVLCPRWPARGPLRADGRMLL